MASAEIEASEAYNNLSFSHHQIAHIVGEMTDAGIPPFKVARILGLQNLLLGYQVFLAAYYMNITGIRPR